MRRPIRQSPGTTSWRIAGLVLIALAVVAGSALGAGGKAPATGPATATPPASPPPAHTHQMRAHIDPETGGLTLRQVPLQLSEALQNALSRSDRGLVPVTLPNGTQLLDLQGRYQTLSVVHLGDRGPELLCTHDAAAVRALPTVTLQSTAPADR